MPGKSDGRATPFSKWLKAKLADQKAATELEVIAVRDALVSELKGMPGKKLVDLGVKAEKLGDSIWKSGLKKIVAGTFGVECKGLGRGKRTGAAKAAKAADKPAKAAKAPKAPKAAKAAKAVAAPAAAPVKGKRGRKPGQVKTAAAAAGMSFEAMLSAYKGGADHPLFAAWKKDVYAPFAAKSAEAAAIMGLSLDALLKKAQ